MGMCPTCRRTFGEGVDVCPEHGTTLLPEEAFRAAETPLVTGQKVGDYVVEEVMAEGGFGTVYRVIHPLIGKSAAIKVLKREFSASPEMVSRFIAEARAVNQIRHRNIIDIFAFGVLDDGRHYYVMELLDGMTLERWVRQRGRLPLLEAVPIVKQLGRALAAAHAAGIVHRDLKPENVFLTFDEDGVPTPKLLDFGIAKLRGTSGSVHKTRSGAPMGTPLYMSPEQVYGREVDHRTDIYALGILVFEVLTGAPPFDGDSVMEVLTAQTTAKAPRVSERAPGLPKEIDAPVAAMLEKDPDKRPQSITAALDQLSTALSEAGAVPVPSRPSAQFTPPPATASDPNAVRRNTLAAATTLANAPSSPPQDRFRKPVLVGAIALTVSVAGGILAAVSTAPPAPQPQSSPVTPASATGEAPAAATAPPVVAVTSAVPSVSASSARISFDGVPEDAEVLLEGKRIASAKQGVELPRSGQRVKLVIKKAGYTPRELWVVPDTDRTISTDLTKIGPKAGSKKPNGDLEF